ncbi:helix-hairpin-helix domain-containing protein, partial [Lysinibacillus telephonicus]
QVIKKYGKAIALPGIVSVILLYFFLQKTDSNEQQLEVITTIPQEQTEQLNSEDEQQEQLVVNKVIVDVKGAVNFPGVYELTTEERVIDAIKKAGGYTEGAESKLVNHAQRLQDEMVIYIPKKGEEVGTLEMDPTQVVNMPSDNSSSASKVNINSADETALTTLPGIGPSKAQAIIAYREDVGSFKSIEDLKNVSGIGDKTYDKLKDLIDVK